MRYPRDYDTVPRLYFWLFHLLWLFPWSVYFPAVAKLNFRPTDRAGKDAAAGAVLDRLHHGLLHLLHHAGILFDAVLSGARAAARIGDGGGGQLDPLRHARALRHFRGRRGGRAYACSLLSWNFPTPGDISAGAQFESRRLQAFARPHGRPDASLRLPICGCRCSLAAAAFLLGAVGTFRATGRRAFLATALMAILFFQAARIAMAAFDPYLSSRPLAEALLRAPAGKAHRRSSLLHFSSVFFYTNAENKTASCC